MSMSDHEPPLPEWSDWPDYAHLNGSDFGPPDPVVISPMSWVDGQFQPTHDGTKSNTTGTWIVAAIVIVWLAINKPKTLAWLSAEVLPYLPTFVVFFCFAVIARYKERNCRDVPNCASAVLLLMVLASMVSVVGV